MFYVYILLSEKDRNIYVGKTNNIQRRLCEHNSGQVASTRSRRPFQLLASIECHSEQEALATEKEYKKGFRREEIKKQFRI